MTNIGDVYADAINDYLGDGWIPNWPLTQPVSLAELCRIKHGRLTYEAAPTTTAVTDSRRIERVAWQYQSADDISVGLSAVVSAGTPETSFTASFARAQSLYISTVGVTTERIDDVGPVRQRLLTSAETLPVGSAVVIERLVAGRLVLLASKTAGAKFEASAQADAASIAAPAELAGKLAFVASKAAVTFEQYDQPTVLATRAVVLGRAGWFWWRRPAVRGVSHVDDRQLLAVMEAASEYFVRADDSEWSS